MNNPIEEGHMDALEEEAVHPAMPQGTIGHGAPNIRVSSTGNRPTSNERPTQDKHATGRWDSRNWSHANQGSSHPSDSDRMENPEPLSEGNDARAGHSRDATSMVTAFEPR